MLSDKSNAGVVQKAGTTAFPRPRGEQTSSGHPTTTPFVWGGLCLQLWPRLTPRGKGLPKEGGPIARSQAGCGLQTEKPYEPQPGRLPRVCAAGVRQRCPWGSGRRSALTRQHLDINQLHEIYWGSYQEQINFSSALCEPWGAVGRGEDPGGGRQYLHLPDLGSSEETWNVRGLGAERELVPSGG